MFPCFFFFNDTATPEIYTLPLHDAFPIYLPDGDHRRERREILADLAAGRISTEEAHRLLGRGQSGSGEEDRKSTPLNSSHTGISDSVFCLQKNTETTIRLTVTVAGSYSPR